MIENAVKNLNYFLKKAFRYNIYDFLKVVLTLATIHYLMILSIKSIIAVERI